MNKFNPVLNFLNKSLGVYKIRGLEIEPTYWMAGTILLLIFMLIFTLARLRYLYVHWSISKPSLSMFFWGFILAIILEGFMVVGGKTFFTEILGWESAPKPISTLLEIARGKVSPVLGTSDKNDLDTLKEIYGSLSESESKEVKEFICRP